MAKILKLTFERSDRSGGFRHIERSQSLPPEFTRPREPRMTFTQDYRLKAWGQGLDQHAWVINGEIVNFAHRGKDLYQAQLTGGQVAAMLDYNPVTSPDIAEDVDKEVSPIARAYQLYNEWRRNRDRNWSEETEETRGFVQTWRGYRNVTKAWLNSEKAGVEEKLQESLDKAKERYAQWDEFRDWWVDLDLEQRSGASGWQGAVRGVENKIVADVDYLGDRIDLYQDAKDDGVSLVQTWTAEVSEAVCQCTGLAPLDKYREDGCAWFYDAERETERFCSLWMASYPTARRNLDIVYRLSGTDFSRQPEWLTMWLEKPWLDLAMLVRVNTNKGIWHPVRHPSNYWDGRIWAGLNITLADNPPPGVVKVLESSTAQRVKDWWAASKNG